MTEKEKINYNQMKIVEMLLNEREFLGNVNGDSIYVGDNIILFNSDGGIVTGFRKEQDELKYEYRSYLNGNLSYVKLSQIAKHVINS